MPVPHILAGSSGGTTTQFDANFDYFELRAKNVNSPGDNVAIGAASAGTGTPRLWVESASSSGCINTNAVTGDATKVHMTFRESNTARGSITSNGSVTAYNTSSDYRLKSGIATLGGSGAFIDALQPRAWTWPDGSAGVGFVAHEVAAVSPSSVVGAKDAVDGAGQPVYQAMEYGSGEFIAHIVAELKSLRARVAALEA